MKPTKLILLTTVLLTQGCLARAQSNSVPGAMDYAAFSFFLPFFIHHLVIKKTLHIIFNCIPRIGMFR